MLFQAATISIFLSLLIVLGNIGLFLEHGMSVACKVKGEGSPDVMSSLTIALRQESFSGAGDWSSGEDLFICGAADGGEEDDKVCEMPVLNGAAIWEIGLTAVEDWDGIEKSVEFIALR